MKRVLFLLLLSMIILGSWAPQPTSAKSAEWSPQLNSPGQVVALINDYRAQNGLPAYVENGTLAVIAQGQADWLISQPAGSVGDVHSGPGGSRPKDRAYNAGYGGGNTIFISEIVKGGYNETPEDALAWWKTSAPHNNTMLASTYVEIGAGVATDGNGRWWYVAVTGYISGVAYAPSASSASTTSGGTTVPQVVMIPVTKTGPQPDGSVMHIIRTGQTLWTVAAVYDVPLAQLLELNGLPEWAVVHPGDEVMVKPAGSEPTATPTAGGETATPTASPVPSRTPTPTRTTQAGSGAAGQFAANSGGGSGLTSNPEADQANSRMGLIVGIALVSLLLVIAASFFIRPAKPEGASDDFDPFAPID